MAEASVKLIDKGEGDEVEFVYEGIDDLIDGTAEAKDITPAKAVIYCIRRLMGCGVISPLTMAVCPDLIKLMRDAAAGGVTFPVEVNLDGLADNE